jgi:hypothetical protein
MSKENTKEKVYAERQDNYKKQKEEIFKQAREEEKNQNKKKEDSRSEQKNLLFLLKYSFISVFLAWVNLV